MGFFDRFSGGDAKAKASAGDEPSPVELGPGDLALEVRDKRLEVLVSRALGLGVPKLRRAFAGAPLS